jgi:hypothetical protein
MRRLSTTLLLLGVALVSNGCSMFRAQFGGGIGIGADVKLPGLLHTGLSAGQYMNVGIRYDTPELSHDASATLVAWHWEGRQNRRREQGRKYIPEHSCWAVLPPLTKMIDRDQLSVWDFEIGLDLLVLDLRVGFNPLRWEGWARSPRPPEPAEPAPTAPPPDSRPVAPARHPTVYERDPLLPPVDPPPERGDDDR